MKRLFIGALVALAMLVGSLGISATPASANANYAEGHTCDGYGWLEGNVYLEQPIGYLGMMARTVITPYRVIPGCPGRSDYWDGSTTQVRVALGRWVYGAGWVSCGYGDATYHGSWSHDVYPGPGNLSVCYVQGWPNGLTSAYVIYTMYESGHHTDFSLTVYA